MAKAQTVDWVSYETFDAAPWKPGQKTWLKFDGQMISENHFPLQTESDDGGPWFMTKTEINRSKGYINTGVNLGYGFRGNYAIDRKSTGWGEGAFPSAVDDLTLTTMGTTAIARVEPTNPNFSLPTAVGELVKDGLPTVLGSESLKERVNYARSSGSEYLNVEFGWNPLVSDVRSFAQSVTRSEDIIRAYDKGAGMKLPRGYYFPASSGSRYEISNYYAIPIHTSLGGLRGPAYETWTSSVWFKGCFKYYLPTKDALGKVSRYASYARKILGVELTPETLWNLAPWSWASDWFSNVGDVLHNVTAIGRDGMVMQYGYVMGQQTYDFTGTGSLVSFGPSMPYISKTIKFKRCRRIAATPYGFGVNPGSLSAKQVSILAALGLSFT